MSLLDDLKEPPPHHSARKECKLITLANGLEDPEVKAAMLAAIDNPRWQARTLASTLTKHGLSITHVSIAAHRNGTCPCYKKGHEQ